MVNEKESATVKENRKAYYKDFTPIERYEAIRRYSDGATNTVQMENKTKVQRTSVTRETRGGYDWELPRRLVREDNFLVHPRTREFILGCTYQKKPKVNHKILRWVQLNVWIKNGVVQPERKPESFPYGHLGGFPTVRYHRTTNRVQISGKFIVKPRSSTERLKPTDTDKLQYELDGDLHYKNTAQYKTVWNTGYQRRSKA